MKNEFEEFEKLIAFLRENLPETICLVRNKERYDEIVRSITEIQEYFVEQDDQTQFVIEKDKLLGMSLCLSVVCQLLSTTDIESLCKVIGKADSIDIEPLCNGKIRFTFGFDNAYKPAPPYQESENRM